MSARTALLPRYRPQVSPRYEALRCWHGLSVACIRAFTTRVRSEDLQSRMGRCQSDVPLSAKCAGTAGRRPRCGIAAVLEHLSAPETRTPATRVRSGDLSCWSPRTRPIALVG